MAKIVAALLILFSSAASIHYSVVGVRHPDSLQVYNKANLPLLWIRLLSLLLGLGGGLVLLPQTFRLGGALLILHSVVTIGCYVATRDWKGGALEVAMLQVPFLMIWMGYPISIVAWARKILP